MKERMVLEEHELYNLLYFLPIQMVKVVNTERKAIFMGREIKPEKVPETWEDLKELCKKFRLVFSKNINMKKDNEYIVCCWLKFYEDGGILDSDGYAIAENRTPQQMWCIIKGLIGE